MRKVFIIYRSFFDENGERLTVGGIQTYIRQLLRLINNTGRETIIVQFANKNFKKKFINTNVYGINVNYKKNEFRKSRVAVSFIKKMYDEQDVIIFASEDLYVPVKFTEKVIAIQHGITWDKPNTNNKIRNSLIFNICINYFQSYQRIKRISKLEHLVCVDYNFINWYRSQVNNVNKQVYIIPNSTNLIYDNIHKDKDKIKILFARRFEQYRGTRLFAKVAKSLINKFENVYISLAGSGSDEKYLKETFLYTDRVDFISYKSEESLEVHSSYHIAVIPSIGSEGTSLSLLEAMAAKCAVVATNIGGMTNIVLDNYNGLLVSPNEDELFLAIEKLIIDRHLREKLSENAYQTVSQAFNISLWEDKWIKVINQF